MASFPEYLTFWGDSAFHPVLCSYQHFNIAPLDCKEIKPVHPKGNQLWIFIGRTDVEIEVPVLWPPDVKNWLIGQDPDAGNDWRQEEKGTTEDEMVTWHHWLNGHEFEQSWRQWRTGKPGVLQSMGLQRAGQDWATEQHNTVNQLYSNIKLKKFLSMTRHTL